MADVPLPLLATLLFTLIGPIALIPTFAATTAGADPVLRRRIAFLAFGTSVVTLAVAVFAGASAMAGAGTSRPALILAGGLILTLTALRNLFAFGMAPPAAQVAAPPSVGIGFSPIAIPGIVTPVGVAVIIIFVSYFPALTDKLAIMAVTLAVLCANLVAMLFAHKVMRVIGAAPLLVLGAVFGVLQVAMGVEMILSGLRRSGLV
jgi:multiple antibiotic resistance protein